MVTNLETVKEVDACAVEAGWLMSRFIQSFLNRVCMSTWPRSTDDLVCCNGKCRCLLLGDAGVCCLVMLVSGARWCRNRCCRFAASLADCCVDISWYLQKGVGEEILWRLSEIALKRAGYDFHKLALKIAVWERLEASIGCSESTTVIGWIPRRPLAAIFWPLGEVQIPPLEARIPTSLLA